MSDLHLIFHQILRIIMCTQFKGYYYSIHLILYILYRQHFFVKRYLVDLEYLNKFHVTENLYLTDKQ